MNTFTCLNQMIFLDQCQLSERKEDQDLAREMDEHWSWCNTKCFWAKGYRIFQILDVKKLSSCCNAKAERGLFYSQNAKCPKFLKQSTLQYSPQTASMFLRLFYGQCLVWCDAWVEAKQEVKTEAESHVSLCWGKNWFNERKWKMSINYIFGGTETLLVTKVIIPEQNHDSESPETSCVMLCSF